VIKAATGRGYGEVVTRHTIPDGRPALRCPSTLVGLR
jgi:hypothetical protein